MKTEQTARLFDAIREGGLAFYTFLKYSIACA